MATFHLSPPWVIFYREVAALFKYDAEVHVVYDEAENHIKLYVDDPDKAEALTRLMPTSKSFGNITVKISVVPANASEIDLSAASVEELFDVAFDGNGAYAFSKSITGIYAPNLTYIVWRKQVVQYWTDDLGDYYGQTSTLYQNIAKDIFGETEGVFFSTDIEDPVFENINSPLGEWP